MMLDWLKNINKDYPDFWRAYLSKFDEKPTRIVALSTKTTGTDYKKDVIVSIGAVAIEGDQVLIGDNFEVVLLQYVFNHDNGLSNEFIVESQLPKLVEPQAIQQFIEYLENATLVGHRVDFDVEMLNEALDRIHAGRLKNEALDIEVMYRKWKDLNDGRHFGLDDICAEFKIPVSERVSAAEDAYAVALLFLKLKSRLQLKI
ncbi:MULTISPECIES: PolC-type DNA polymerase III [unclassified Flavobacterium]|uniref:3'-5' exonuclease n=1 Tax=unclassified Flavobacterium TaxID=196869 RepID=UPI001F1426CE|nr:MULTISPECIES: 3'-5' exonuclease [unclassified Flavobacterium]UMY65021.1 3'-5' exonuclease [Flavobacterium sp. HJ-32-4]